MKTEKINELVKAAIKLASRNERGRLLLSETKIYGYLCGTGQRLPGMDAEESARTTLAEIKKVAPCYEYEQGCLHVND